MSMIYKEGTASLTKGSPVLKGKDTFFLNPIFNVGVGQIVQVKTGDNVYVNSIKEVVDNETLILSFDSLEDVTDGEIVIMITMVDSISDTANKLLGMTRGLVQFETEMTRWFTSMDKKITITLPDGTKKEVYTLQAIMEQVAQNEKEMQELLQNSEKKVNDMVDKAQTDVNQVVTDGTNKINQAVDKADKEINEAITSGTGKIDTMLTESQKKIDKTIEDTEIKVDTELGKIDEKIGNSLDGKVNKTGDTMTGALTTTTKVITQSANGENSVGFVSNNSGVSFIEYKKGSDYHTNKIPEKSGTILLSGDFGLGSNAVYDGSTPSSQSPKDANDITSTGFYGGGGSSALNYFNNYYPILSMTRTGGDGTGYITQIQGSDGELGFRHRVQNNWTDWLKLAVLDTLQTQTFKGAIKARGLDVESGNDYFGMRIHSNGTPAFYSYRNGKGYDYMFPNKSGEVPLIYEGNITNQSSSDFSGLRLIKGNKEYCLFETTAHPTTLANIIYRKPDGSNVAVVSIPKKTGTLLVDGDYGIGLNAKTGTSQAESTNANNLDTNGFWASGGSNSSNFYNPFGPLISFARGGGTDGTGQVVQIQASSKNLVYRMRNINNWTYWSELMNVNSDGVKSSKLDFKNNGFYTSTNIDNDATGTVYMGFISAHATQPEAYQIGLMGRNKKLLYTYKENSNWLGTYEVLHLGNAKPDSNGFYKKASPIIDVFTNGSFKTNDESEGATVTRVAQGEYLIEGVLGFNSDAGWGGVDGGIEIPLDVNKQPLIWVDSEVLEDGSIIIRTYHREHKDVPPFARNLRRGYNDGDPCDIPTGRFISIRVNMPENSIFNTRERESMEEMKEMESNPFYKEERAFPNIVFNKKGDL
ncbi:tail fiber protein [Proteus phage Vb_PmiP-P59]|uniref:Phage tail protein C-terminal domain-containing protein n=1 Tax=Proteus phage Vb_PmiP-P59 TaxID=2754975 RepID=A0A7G5CG01_9CAUD|nr:tail fiber protein [Proteus phage Vb_PmiP-P59]QMV48203.1 hypothetical protein [Proteus phage Vb_PmiP-P59]